MTTGAPTLRLGKASYYFVRDDSGFNIYRVGDGWVGWSAGSLRDAKDTARDIERRRA